MYDEITSLGCILSFSSNVNQIDGCQLDRYEEEQRRQDWSENQDYYRQTSYGARSTAGPPGDPQGYYAALGIPTNASTQEIQSAFRGLAMKWRKYLVDFFFFFFAKNNH
jgi:hypothetical protein